jgi:hypothetical protein
MQLTPFGQRWGRQWALLGAIVAWFALGLQFYLSNALVMSQGRSFAATLFVYFGYFTILTNLLSACMLTAAARRVDGATSTNIFLQASTVGGIAVSMALVGLVYNVVLRPLYSPEGLARLADELLHVVMPLVALLYAWLCVRKSGLQWSDALKWAVYPLVYLVYAMVRGALSGAYPYPFVDVAKLGYPTVMVNSVGVCVVFMLMALLFIALGRWKDRSI